MLVTNLLSQNEATTIYSDEEVENKDVMQSCLINGTLQFFHDILFLHPPLNQQSRNGYIQIFQKEFVPLSKEQTQTTCGTMWQFVSALLDIHLKPRDCENIYGEEVLELYIDVMQKDIEFFCKHSHRKEKNENFPLVKYLFDVKSSSYNEENVETLLTHFMKSIKV